MSILLAAALTVAGISEWTDVTTANGVWDEYYQAVKDANDCSFRFRMMRNRNGVTVEAYVRDDAVVVDDCAPGQISCETWKDDCLEIFFDGDHDRNPNTRGEDYENNPTPCNAGGEYAMAANGSSQSDYASSKKCFGELWGGTAEPWMEGETRVGTFYRLWFTWKAMGLPAAPRNDESVKFGFTICVHDDDDGKACDHALYWKGSPKIPYADERAFGEVELKPFEPFDPIVPVMLGVEKVEVIAGDLRRARDEFGFRRFILVGPSAFRYFGKNTPARFTQIGHDIAAIKRLLADTDIRIGWWCDPTFHAHDSEPWQRIMDCEGHETGSVCPLDENHIADFAGKLCTGLRLGKPELIFIEDDFTLSNHGGMNAMKGCFCPLHMKAYEKKVGKAYTPAEVAAMFRNRTKENEPLRQAWADMSRESLCHFARSVRKEIDKIAPATRVCQCQSGFVDIDGDSTEAVARAWAGDTRPMSRLFGAGYAEENNPPNVPRNVAHVFWSAQQLSPDIEIIHETDAYPHMRFFNSSLFLMSEFVGALMAGVQDSYYYCLQYTDAPLCDDGYVARMRDYRKRLETAREFRLGAKPVGVRMVYTPKESYMVRETSKPASSGMLTASTYFLTKLGFPVITAKDAPMATLLGNTAAVLSDDEIRELLKGGLFLDGEAAEILTKRGFADLIGAEAKDDTDYTVSFYTERILPAAGCKCRGTDLFHRRFKSKPIIGWTPKHAVFAAFKLKPGAEVLADFRNTEFETTGTSVYYFENRLGGRIGVMARSVDASPHMSIYSPRKQELLHNLFVRLSGGRIAVTAPKTPSTYLLAAEKNGELLVALNNLAGEPRDDIDLRFAPEWDASSVELMDEDGAWKPLPKNYSFEPMVPCFLRVKGRK